MPNNDTPISSFQDATEINSADKLTGLQNNVNRNFSFSTILSWFVQTVAAAFVPVGRKVNNKALSADITLDASDVGAQGAITASGILKGNGAGGVSAAVAGTDYGTYSKPSGGIPSSDMTSAVQTSLGLADSAYQLPSGGIPASDLASGVIPTVPSAYTANPAMDGTASPGSSGNWAKGDHVHPSDTTKAAKADLTNIQATGTTNTTGAAIPDGAYFYLNGVLHRAKTQINVNATFTVNTNCEQVTGGGFNDFPKHYTTTPTTNANGLASLGNHAIVYSANCLTPYYYISNVYKDGSNNWYGTIRSAANNNPLANTQVSIALQVS